MSKKVNIPLRKGTLPGYHPSDTITKRRKILSKLSKKNPMEIKKKLTALSTVTKNTQPTNSKKYKADERWLKKKMT